jgi:hypothetical protein
MALNIYAHWSAERLIERRDKLSQEEDKIVTSVSAGDTSVAKQQTSGIRQAIHSINKALYKIAIREGIDPTTFNLDEDSFICDRTQARFSGTCL